MRTQEFNSKLISLLPLDEVPVHVPLRRPRPLRFERLPVPVWNPDSRGRLGPAKSEDRKGGEGKTDANLTNYLSTFPAGGTPTRRHALGRLPTPPPLPENLLLGLHRKLPSVPPASTQEVSESENRPATRGTAHSEVQGDARCTTRCNVRPMAALHLLLPTGESIRTQEFRFQTNLPSPARRGSRSRLPLRRPRLLRFERLRVSVESIQPRPPRPCEVGRPKGRRRKNRRQSHNFF